jgi:hypothetical protein
MHVFDHIFDNIDLKDLQKCSGGADLEKQVKEAAYFGWLNAGRPSGRDLEFWCQAERQIVGGTADECYRDFVELLHDSAYVG